MLQINFLYKSILEALMVSCDDQGLATLVTEDGGMPVMVDQKRLALPIQDLLKNSPWDTITAFHPLSENVVLGESPVLKKLKSLVNLRLTSIISILMTELLEIAADTDNHTKLSAAQKKFLKKVPEADEKTVKALEYVIRNISVTGKNRLTNVYLRRGAKLKGVGYQRVAVVSFPILEQFEPMETVVVDEEGKSKKVYQIFGVTMRKRDKETIHALLNFLIPHGESLEAYSGGSNSLVAPYFESLIRAFINVAKQLNSITDIFKSRLKAIEDVYVPLHWEELFQTFEQFRNSLPTPLPGNDGSGGNAQETETQPAAVPPKAIKQPQPYTAKEELVPAPSSMGYKPMAAKATDDGQDWLDMMAQRRMGQQNHAPFAHLSGQPQPMQQPYHQPGGWAPQPMGYGYQQPPQYPYQQQQAPFAHLAPQASHPQPYGNKPGYAGPI